MTPILRIAIAITQAKAILNAGPMSQDPDDRRRRAYWARRNGPGVFTVRTTRPQEQANLARATAPATPAPAAPTPIRPAAPQGFTRPDVATPRSKVNDIYGDLTMMGPNGEVVHSGTGQSAGLGPGAPYQGRVAKVSSYIQQFIGKGGSAATETTSPKASPSPTGPRSTPVFRPKGSPGQGGNNLTTPLAPWNAPRVANSFQSDTARRAFFAKSKGGAAPLNRPATPGAVAAPTGPTTQGGRGNQSPPPPAPGQGPQESSRSYYQRMAEWEKKYSPAHQLKPSGATPGINPPPLGAGPTPPAVAVAKARPPGAPATAAPATSAKPKAPGSVSLGGESSFLAWSKAGKPSFAPHTEIPDQTLKGLWKSARGDAATYKKLVDSYNKAFGYKGKKYIDPLTAQGKLFLGAA